MAEPLPDVVLMDLNLPGTPGLEATRRIAATRGAAEAEVLVLVADGRSDPDIARELGLSLKTVQNHVSHVPTTMQVPTAPRPGRRMRGF